MKMKYYILILITTISNMTLHGQNIDTWFTFWNRDSTLIGYKDKNNVVKIEPKFTGLNNTFKFENIIAVSEEKDTKRSSYYLTKSGRKVGIDSLYIFDNSSDCESEGFIRFRDQKTNKAGMFNKNGDVVIPAIYNDLTRVRNGMIIALEGAEKINLEGEEFYSWIGGNEILIDTNNNILIDNFNLDNNLNFYSVEKLKYPNSNSARKTFLAKDGSYYSFDDFECEFKEWITNELKDSLTLERLINISFDTIAWESSNGWNKSSKEKLITGNFTIIKNGLLEILEPNASFNISIDGLNPLLYEGKDYEKYFNNCGESKDWIYPSISLIITPSGHKNNIQNHYEFLRTDIGYKLISLTIRNKKMK